MRLATALLGIATFISSCDQSGIAAGPVGTAAIDPATARWNATAQTYVAYLADKKGNPPSLRVSEVRVLSHSPTGGISVTTVCGQYETSNSYGGVRKPFLMVGIGDDPESLLEGDEIRSHQTLVESDLECRATGHVAEVTKNPIP